MSGGGVGDSYGAYSDGREVTEAGTVMVKLAYYGDVDLGGDVNGNDVNYVLGNLNATTSGFGDFGLSYLWGDVNGDGVVDGSDVILVLGNLDHGSGGTNGDPL